MTKLETEFRNTLFSDQTVYEIINREFGQNVAHLFDLVNRGERAFIHDTASTKILESMFDVYRA